MARRVDLSALGLVASRLEPLGVRFAFTGGAVVGFLLDNPAIPFPRGTLDVDAIVEVSTRIAHTELEAQLRQAGFRHDTSEGAPRCRWLLDGIKVDILPMLDPTGEWSSRWFEHALHTATIQELHGIRLPVVSAPCFLATKLDALADRGRGDYRISHDLEDIVAVVDGRAALYEELASEQDDLRKAVADAVRKLLGQSAFRESLPGHMLSDDASQARVPLLLARLEQIAGLG
ncbi:MAG: hypothetical protein RBT03_02730 [Kiritimatiellia bacterium]|jgi:predicted nucleotidyltransferase|nr:hypothetical protein [Kiritimatiellia bacterium]